MIDEYSLTVSRSKEELFMRYKFYLAQQFLHAYELFQRDKVYLQTIY